MKVWVFEPNFLSGTFRDCRSKVIFKVISYIIIKQKAGRKERPVDKAGWFMLFYVKEL
jgi:hypothetical protein